MGLLVNSAYKDLVSSKVPPHNTLLTPTLDSKVEHISHVLNVALCGPLNELLWAHVGSSDLSLALFRRISYFNTCRLDHGVRC